MGCSLIRVVGLTAVACLASAANAGQEAPFVSVKTGPIEAIDRSLLVGPAPLDQPVHLCVCLTMPQPAALQTFVDDVSDPGSPHYRQFLGPAQLGARFGQSPVAVAAVSQYLREQGFQISLTAKDNLHILAEGTVGQAQAAFHTQINRYHSLSLLENGHEDYFANAGSVQLPAQLAAVVEHVEGLQNWNKGRPESILSPGQASVLYNTSPLVNAGQRMLGQGRTIGISSWDGFALSNTQLFIEKYRLPIPPRGILSNISVRTIQGGSESGQRLAEGDLDPQMVIGQAPLATVIIYDGPGGGDSATDPQVLSVYVKEEDDDAVDLITESYAWALGNQAAIEAHTVHLLMSAEGITYMAASGDDQSTEEQQYWYPDCEPEVLLVGGTSATVDTAGNRESEVPWESGSGGWSTINLPFNHRPSWQKGRGVPAIYNFRLNPDVAGHASGNPQGSQGSHYFYYNGHLESGYIGTSFACPVFASGLAIAEEALIAQNKIPKDSGGHFRLGRLQDLIYQQNGNPLVWHDITKGSNGTLPNGLPSDASAGWDTCSGWGAVNWDGFVKAFPVGAYP